MRPSDRGHRPRLQPRPNVADVYQNSTTIFGRPAGEGGGQELGLDGVQSFFGSEHLLKRVAPIAAVRLGLVENLETEDMVLEVLAKLLP